MKARLKKATGFFVGVTLPTVALLILTIVIGLKNLTTREDTYVLPTIILGAGFFLFFIAFMVFTNKWLNVLRLRRANERTGSTADGAKLLEMQGYLQLYEWLSGVGETAEEENAVQIQETQEE